MTQLFHHLLLGIELLDSVLMWLQLSLGLHLVVVDLVLMLSLPAFGCLFRVLGHTFLTILVPHCAHNHVTVIVTGTTHKIAGFEKPLNKIVVIEFAMSDTS